MESQTPRELLKKFYDDNNLGNDGGNSFSYVKIELTPKFYFFFPNFDERRKAVALHDIHHLITGYKTTLAGESEISAWEIASGCKSYWTAFFINTSGFMIGIPFNFYAVLKAFARGRKTRNLYGNTLSVEQAADMKIVELKKQFKLDVHEIDTKPTLVDFILFLGFAFYGLIYSILAVLLLPFIVLYTIFILIMKLK